FLLTGKVPFAGGTSLEKLVRHGSEVAAPVNEVRTEIPAEVAAIVAKLIAKKPEERFQTPAELVTALAPFATPSAGSLPAISTDLAEVEATTTDSPWADIFDGDERNALISTMPADFAVTPVSPINLMHIKKAAPARKRKIYWLSIAIFVAAALI